VYGHLQGGSFKVSVGDLIEAGTVVAAVGATGVVTACHLDLKIGINGSFTSPVPYLASRGLRL
jgi:murein DD-endopeptidase MepM/ murein hydrolase activator NlpD